MTKRIISLLLAIVVLMLNTDIFVTAFAENAEDDLELKSITVIYNKSTKKVNVLEDKEHNYYMNTSDISAFSHFKYSTEKSTFYYDLQDPNSFCPKEVLVHKEAKSIWVKNHWLYCESIKTERPFTRIIEQNGVTFLPIDVIFPCLDTSITVTEGKLIIEPAESTVAESLCNIDVNLGTNDLDRFSCSLCDFTENQKIVYISTLYEDLTHVRVSRLPGLKKMIPNVKIDHFENAFTSYLLDNSAYLDAVKNSDSAVKQIAKKILEANDSLQDDIDGVKTFGVLPKEIAKKMAEANRIDDDWLGDTTLYDGFEKIGDGLDKASFGIDIASAAIATYNAHEYAVADNISMLSAVYDLENRSFKYDIFMKEEDIEALAAQTVYNTSTESLLTAISDSIKKEIIKHGVDKLTEDALAVILNKSWIDAERWILSKIFPKFTTTAGIMEKLPYHYLISDTALQEFKYRRYNAYQERNVAEHYGHESRTEEHITKARQSLILYLTASKHCYKSIKEVYEVNHQKFSLCDKKIAEIDELLIKLYLAGFSVKHDSLESLKTDIAEISKNLSNLKVDDPVNDLNISAVVFANAYQSIDNSRSAPMYAESSSNSKLLTTIPNGTIVTIISVPDNYQDGAMDHLMVLVDYNGQQGYVNSLCLRCDPNIDVSSYSQDQVLDLGKILFQECDCYSWMPVSTASLLDYTSSDQYDGDYQKMLPAGLTISQLKDEFYKYFSSSIVGFIEGSFQEKDGYLWQITGYGDRIWLDHYEVKSVKSKSDTEIVYEVDEIIDPNFYDYYPPTRTFEFKIVNENGKWMLTIPDRTPEQPSAQYYNTNQTYEDIYGSLVFDGANDTRGLFGHEDYIPQPTGYRIKQYFLDDINNDGIKELILEVTVFGTDEMFRECFTYTNGSVQWVGTYDDIYMLRDCYLAKDGSGLVVIGWNGGTANPYIIEFHNWNPWNIKEQDHRIPYVRDLPMIGDLASDDDHVEDHTPYASIPDNIRNKLGKKLVAYSPADRSPLKETFSSTSLSEQPVSISSVSDKYTAIQGIVNTEKSDLMLRRLPDANDKSNVISKIPKGTKITLLLPFKSYFARDDGDQTYWYYADYNGKTGFVSAKYIKETTERVGMNDEQITSVAKLLLLSAMNAESWSYSNCFDYNVDDRVLYPNSNEYYFYHINGLHTKEDWYAEVHKMFSAKYDSIRYFNEGLDSLLKSHGIVPPNYWNTNNEWYLSDVVFRKGDIPLDIAYSEPFRVVHLTKQKESGNEVFFNGYLDYSQGDSAWVYDGGIDNIDNFSICFEDGRWKVGLF